MPENKINDADMLRLVNKGVPQAEVAKKYGVSRAAVCQRLKEFRGRTTRAIVAKKVETAIDRQLDAVGQLTEINQKTLDLLNEAEQEQDKTMQLRCIAEARAQLKLCAEIQLSLYSQQDAHVFMQLITEALKKASQESYEEFKRLVANERTIRSVLKFA